MLAVVPETNMNLSSISNMFQENNSEINMEDSLIFQTLNMKENAAVGCIYKFLDNVCSDENEIWGNEFFYIIDGEYRSEDDQTIFANDFDDMRRSTKIIFDEFEYGIRWKILPKEESYFDFYDGCFTFDYKYPLNQYNWQCKQIYRCDVDDNEEHVFWVSAGVPTAIVNNGGTRLDN